MNDTSHLVDITKQAGELVGWFRSVDAMTEFAIPQMGYQANNPNHWREFAGGNVAECAAYIAKGAGEAEQAPVRQALAKIDAALHDRPRREYVASPVGAFPVVADVLAGRPMAMRRHEYVEHEAAPLRVFVDVSTSSGVTGAELATRGAAVVALLMRLAETHPLKIYAVAANKVHRTVIGIAVPIESTPVDLSYLTAIFTSPQFTRGIRIPAQAQLGKANVGMLKLPWAYCSSVYGKRETGMRGLFGITTDDVYIAGASLNWISEITRDPVTWVQNRLRQQRKSYLESR